MTIRNAKPAAKLIKLSDGGGLQLWIESKGGKYWRLAYRFSAKQRVLALGTYPTVSLKAARVAREAAKVHLYDGNDPSQQHKVRQVNGVIYRCEYFFKVG